MNLYAILRRSGWKSPADLEEAAARSAKVGDEDMPDDIRWIRSYVLEEGGGSVGTVCIYQASSPEAIREHAGAADLPVDEIIPIADTVIVRPDPEPAATQRCEGRTTSDERRGHSPSRRRGVRSIGSARSISFVKIRSPRL
jgi:hypothetical protein